jgi:SagB-type dehydrogenase family enzyme
VKPFQFKVYADLEPIALPRELDALSVDTLFHEPSAQSSGAPAARLTLSRLATVLFHSAGVTRTRTYPGGGEVLFRAAPSTGALYQTEVYVAAGDVEGLAPGLYHFCPGDFALRRLRDGDVRAALAEAAADEGIGHRAATVILTAIYWRNTWKYQARGYRHLFWDSGTMLANLAAAAGALGMAPKLYTGFVDRRVNHLLGLDTDREAALELVALGPETAADIGNSVTGSGGGVTGRAEGAVTRTAGDAVTDEIHHRVVPLSSREVDYPALREIHEASGLDSATAVREWRVTGRARWETNGRLAHGLSLPAPRAEAGRTLGETIERRGSTRAFSSTPLSAVELATALHVATRPVDADVDLALVSLYLIVNAVDGIAPGAYGYRPAEHALELIRHGEFRDRSAFLCLDQALGGDAAAAIYFLAPLDAILAAYGNRGYRLVNLAAGLAGGRAYLAAYAQGFGATGLTFYDGHVVDFFSPHAAGQDAIFVTALGRSRVRPRTDEAVIPVVSRLGRPGR